MTKNVALNLHACYSELCTLKVALCCIASTLSFTLEEAEAGFKCLQTMSVLNALRSRKQCRPATRPQAPQLFQAYAAGMLTVGSKIS